jgi:hypothetical protein
VVCRVKNGGVISKPFIFISLMESRAVENIGILGENHFLILLDEKMVRFCAFHRLGYFLTYIKEAGDCGNGCGPAGSSSK